MEIVFLELVLLLMAVSVVTCQFRGFDSLFRTCGCLQINNSFCFMSSGFLHHFDLYLFNNLNDCAVEMAQSVRNSPHKRKVGCSHLSRQSPESLKQVLTTPLSKGNRCECHNSLEITIKIVCPVSD